MKILFLKDGRLSHGCIVILDISPISEFFIKTAQIAGLPSEQGGNGRFGTRVSSERMQVPLRFGAVIEPSARSK
jgi:hypothetical protein